MLHLSMVENRRRKQRGRGCFLGLFIKKNLVFFYISLHCSNPTYSSFNDTNMYSLSIPYLFLNEGNLYH